VPVARDGRRRWDLAAPYLLQHALEHARSAGRAEALLRDAEFLLCRPPDPTGAPLPGWAAAVRAADEALPAGVAAAVRRVRLAIEALRNGEVDLAYDLVRPPGRATLAWRPVWVAGTRSDAVAQSDAAGADPPRAGEAYLVVAIDVTGTVRGYDQAARAK